MPRAFKFGEDSRQRVYDFIIAYKQANDGNSPSLRDISEGAQLLSTAHIHGILRDLVADGLIEIGPRSTRGIRVVGGQWQPPRHRGIVGERRKRAASSV